MFLAHVRRDILEDLSIIDNRSPFPFSSLTLTGFVCYVADIIFLQL